MTEETRFLLANCAASFLLLLAFITFVGLTAALYLFVRGLTMARDGTPTYAAQTLTYVEGAEQRTRETASSVLEPQIRAASAVAGLKAGWRALVGRSRDLPSPADGDDAAPL